MSESCNKTVPPIASETRIDFFNPADHEYEGEDTKKIGIEDETGVTGEGNGIEGALASAISGAARVSWNR